MIGWLDTLARTLRAGTPAMLVVVAKVEGSGPREAGARMIVTDEDFFGTIGGGQLEFEALQCARAALESAPDVFSKRYPLGPELGQCCGGAVTVVFEPFTAADAAWVEQVYEQAAKPVDIVRCVEQRAGGFKRAVVTGTDASHFSYGFSAEFHDGGFSMTERLCETRQPVWLFGAGHVGRALAAALAPLPFKVTWLDSRASEFPDELPDGVRMLAPAMPDLMVDEAPPESMFIVMTHSHALDQEICEAVLRRRDFAYLGLIGSDTKAARFASRLRAKGLADTDIARLHCPIGLPGITGKAPEVIAASVAADLLARLEKTSSNSQFESVIGGSLDV